MDKTHRPTGRGGLIRVSSSLRQVAGRKWSPRPAWMPEGTEMERRWRGGGRGGGEQERAVNAQGGRRFGAAR